ncbi:Protein of unknown function [Cotesia congregata]|uniref:Uncharacterized protein n=1 Tax=Cotesia congregata TaxID=51543 RepID=A0A8J2H8S6_COTCN|nr:Protein of unknown function [Cotesia congregata]
MHLLYSSAIVIWTLFILQSISQIAVTSCSSSEVKKIEVVTSTTENIVQLNLIEIKEPLAKPNNYDWRESGNDPNLAKFNSINLISINEEKLTSDKRCTGNCDSLDDHGRVSGRSLNDSNQCPGDLLNCWFQSKTEKRKKAEKDAYDTRPHLNCGSRGCSPILVTNPKYDGFKKVLDHTGNMCKCRCHRTYNLDSIDEDNKLLDSICFDPVSVDKGFVATGTKFTRHDNVIYLQLRQARLSNGRLIETTKKWTDLKRCSPANTKPVYNSDLNKYLEIKLEDIILPENAVVTGVTLEDSVQGRYLNDNSNFDEKRGEITQRSQCSGSTTYSVFGNYQVKPSTGVSIRDNNEFSKSCQSHILFQGSSQDNEKLPYVVPYVDLREIVTESPEAIRGIGWHHRGFPGYGGFLALKIFKKV